MQISGLGGPFQQGIMGSQSINSLKNMMMGTPSETRQIPRYNQEQQGAFSQLLSRGLAGSDFGGIEQQARKQFSEGTVPSLAERFTSMGIPGGTGGGQRSSAFQSSLGRAGSDLESQLAGLKSQYGMQQLGMGLTPQFDTSYFQHQPGMLEHGAESAMNQIMPLLMRMLAMAI